jgi:hypothetical protein
MHSMHFKHETASDTQTLNQSPEAQQPLSLTDGASRVH